MMPGIEEAQRRLALRLQGAEVARGGEIPRRTDAGPAPLSFSQQRLWLLHQSDPDSGYYNLARVLRIRGPLDVYALEQSLNEIVRRHPTLRTVIESPDGTPQQVVQPARDVPLDIEETRSEDECEQRILALLCMPFRLDTEWPFRWRLYRVGSNDHRLALVFHHVAVDGWALRVLFTDLGRFYGAFVKGLTPRYSAPPIEYSDFSRWQRSVMESNRLDAQCQFWEKQLRALPAILALPLDRLRPVEPSHEGSSERRTWLGDDAARVRLLAKSSRTTLFAVLLAGLEALLARYCRQRDFVIGIPVAARTQPELEGMIGCFANTVLVRSSLEDDPSFTDLIERVAAGVSDAVANQDVPFELLMERLKGARGEGQPRLQVLFSHLHRSEYVVDLPGLQCSVERTSRVTSRCDLTIFVTDVDDSIDVEIEYDTDLFEAATIRRFLSHYCSLLRSAAMHPETTVSRLSMVPAEELAELRQFNETAREYPQEPAHRIFEGQAGATPEALAMVDGTVRLTYGRLNAAANRIAHHLLSLGVKPGNLVAVCPPRTAYLAAVLLGVWKAGAAWVPLDEDDPEPRVRRILTDCGAALMLAPSGLAWRNPPVRVVSIEQALESSNEDNPAPCGGPDDLAYVMYTSGSTGRPKGVEVRHRGIVRLVMGNPYATFGAEETFLAASTVRFDASTFELWGSLLHGSKCVQYPGRIPEIRELERLIREERITTVWLTSALFNAIVDEAPECLRGVRQLLAGGESLSVAHIRRALAAMPETQLINGYGPTENTTFTCCWSIPRTLPERLPSIPIGGPIANSRTYVLDEHGELCGVDVPGEIYIGGDGLASGYRHSRELTAERFVLAAWGERLFRTGDLGRWRETGAIEFLGRIDSQVKIRGFRIEPGEVEAALEEHAEVESAFVVAREDGGVRRLVAYIQPQAGAQLSESGVRAHLSQRLPHFLMPELYCFVAEIPRNANGKRDAAALPVPPRPATNESREARTKTEERLMGLVRGLLPEARIGADTNLFDAGLSSLLATRLVAQMERTFGRRLPLRTLFQGPTVEGLAGAIDGGAVESSITPFFVAHAGTLFEPLASRMTDRPIHGIGFSSTGRTPRTIEEHAGYEAETMVRICPEGPYLVGGWSASGVLAFEIARQLTAQGRKVALVVLFDSPNYAHFRQAGWIRRGIRAVVSRVHRFFYHVSVLARRRPGEWGPYLRERMRTVRRASRQLIAEAQYRRDPDGAQRMEEDQLFVAAARHYRPQPYAGRVLLIHRGDREREWQAAADLGWRDVVTGDLDIRTMTGDHLTIFEEPNVGELAELLREQFDAAIRPAG